VDSTEAYNAALWFSGDLTPPDSLVSRHLFNLKYIRSVFADSVSQVSIRFQPPWEIGVLAVKFDDTTAALVRNGTYTGWDTLPPVLRPDSILEEPNEMGWAYFRFARPFHPARLADIYRNLRGVLYTEPNFVFNIFGFFTVIPWLVDGKYSYDFVFEVFGAGGDFEYFKFTQAAPDHAGTWSSQRDSVCSWCSEIPISPANYSTWNGFR
jgi:hypothetical protein